MRPLALASAILALLAGYGGHAALQAPPPPAPAATATAPPAASIHQAAIKGDPEAVARLVTADPALVGARDDDGITPLAFAAAFGHLEVAKLLINRGADVNAADRRGITALHVAVWRNRTDIVRLLLEKGANARATGPAGNGPLHVAAMNAQLEIAAALIARKADLGVRNAFGNTSLHLAAASNSEAGMARLLVDAGADVNAANPLDGATPLDVAVREGRTAVADLLRSRGATAGREPTAPLRGPYLGQAPPGTMPVLFAPNLVSTEQSELCAVFSPDGSEFYFARSEGERGARIRTATLQDGGWERPKPVTFAGDYSSVDMFLSADGRRLYFCSNRALDGRGAAKPDSDVWVVTRAAGGWGEPVNLGDAVNSSENDYYPTLTAGGNLYFSSRRAGGAGGNDIYRSRLVEGRFSPAENIGAPINTEKWEFDPYIANDESYIIFASNRAGGLGDSDLYISVRARDGSWAPPRNLGAPINSVGPEYTPMLSPDGRYLFFTSGRNGPDDIYWVAAAVIDRFIP